MRTQVAKSTWKTVLAAAVIALILANTARAESKPPVEDATKVGPVVRTDGAEGGYRTEVKSETKAGGGIRSGDQAAGQETLIVIGRWRV